MAQRMVIVIEYDANPDADQPLAEAMEQVRARMHHPDQPNIKVVQVYAAIKESAEQVLAVFEP